MGSALFFALPIFGGFMISFLTSCFDLLFNILKVDNLVIVLPFCSLVVSFLFLLVSRLIRGKYY